MRRYLLLVLGAALAAVVFLMATAPVRELPPNLVTPMTAGPPVTANVEVP